MIDRACQRRCALYSRYYNLNMLQSFPQLGTPRFIEYLADAMARRISYGVAGPTSDLRIDLFPPMKISCVRAPVGILISRTPGIHNSTPLQGHHSPHRTSHLRYCMGMREQGSGKAHGRVARRGTPPPALPAPTPHRTSAMQLHQSCPMSPTAKACSFKFIGASKM